jgi:hypothetical protein
MTILYGVGIAILAIQAIGCALVGVQAAVIITTKVLSRFNDVHLGEEMPADDTISHGVNERRDSFGIGQSSEGAPMTITQPSIIVGVEPVPSFSSEWIDNAIAEIAAIEIAMERDRAELVVERVAELA